jgi:hypothetical protein
MLATLSSITAMTLTTIAISRQTSNARPAGVSASKITSCRRARRRDRLASRSAEIVMRPS